MKILLLYLLAVNLAAFSLMGLDKRKARRHQWRIPEKVLFLLPILGGALGGVLGMLVFRHKTRHWYFRLGFPILLLLQALALAFFLYVGDYYPANETALAALDSTDAVQVSQEGYTWFFDGPGEDRALVFYPGGKVEATAYAPLLHRLAEAGVDCFLAEMPFHLAVFGSNRAGKIMETKEYAHWYLAGHSLGGAMAASYASKHPQGLEGLILLAAYPTTSLPEGLTVLSIYGSEDGVIDREKLSSGRAYMPGDYTELCIEGGNHAWFGSYGEQKGDGAVTIPHESQWAQTVEAILSAQNGARG